MATLLESPKSTVLALSFAIMLVVTSIIPGIAEGTTSTQTVNFVVSDSSSNMKATLATSVTWDKDLSIDEGSQVDISYTLSSAPGTLKLTVPLSRLGIGLTD